MMDGLLSGLLGGLFGPALANWMSHFKYRVIFLTATFASHVCFFISGVISKGLERAVEICFTNGFNPVFIFAPMMGGVFAVFIAFVGSLSNAKGNNVSNSEDK